MILPSKILCFDAWMIRTISQLGRIGFVFSRRQSLQPVVAFFVDETGWPGEPKRRRVSHAPKGKTAKTQKDAAAVSR